jgi:nitrogen-specific signal transduction histidine kinase
MKKIKKTVSKKVFKPMAANFLDRLGEESWTYIKTVVDILHEPILILDEELRVMAANEPFYRTFQTNQKDTEGNVVYKLGNSQWNIPSLKKLLEDILPKNTFFKGFEVSQEFPVIGYKVMILNARQIYCKEDATLEPCPPIILLAIEDVTEMMTVAKKLADHTNNFQLEMTKRTEQLEAHIRKLNEEMNKIKNKPL